MKNTQQENERMVAPALSDAEDVQQLVDDIGLGTIVSVTSTVSPRGKRVIQLHGKGRSQILDVGMLSLLNDPKQQLNEVLKMIVKLFSSDVPQSVSTQDLMRRKAYATSSLSEIDPQLMRPGKSLLSSVAELSDETIPCSYGSTGGLNFAELLETMVCAETARVRGLCAETVFSMTGTRGGRSNNILSQSARILPDSAQADLEEFIRNLGTTGSEQIKSAAEMLIQQDPQVHIVQSDTIMRGLGRDFSLGKLFMLARLSGGDPSLFQSRKTSWEIARSNRAEAGRSVCEALPLDRPDDIGGIVYYARDAVIARESSGHVLLPMKITTHANIYKIHEAFGALVSQRTEQGDTGGAIICPIQKHRIQTRAQTVGGDPCDVRVLAYLSQRSACALESLVRDFRAHCRVLTPQEAVEHDGYDKRLIIEDYFEV